MKFELKNCKSLYDDLRKEIEDGYYIEFSQFFPEDTHILYDRPYFLIENSADDEMRFYIVDGRYIRNNIPEFDDAFAESGLEMKDEKNNTDAYLDWLDSLPLYHFEDISIERALELAAECGGTII